MSSTRFGTYGGKIDILILVFVGPGKERREEEKKYELDASLSAFLG